MGCAAATGAPRPRGRDFGAVTAQAHCGARLAQVVGSRRDGGLCGSLPAVELPRRQRAVQERAGHLPGGLSAAPHLRGQHLAVSGVPSAPPRPSRHPAAAGAVTDVQILDGCRMPPMWRG